MKIKDLAEENYKIIGGITLPETSYRGVREVIKLKREGSIYITWSFIRGIMDAEFVAPVYLGSQKKFKRIQRAVNGLREDLT